MHIGILRIEFHLPGAHSLKEKRRPLKSLLQRLQNRFHCAVAEVDHQDAHQRSSVGIAVVASDTRLLASQLGAIREFVERDREMAVLHIVEEIRSGPTEFGSKDVMPLVDSCKEKLCLRDD